MKHTFYNQELNIIETRFSGSPTLSEFQTIAYEAIELLGIHNTSKMLNNITELEVNSLENQEWAQNYWFPKVVELGLRYFAFIKPKNVFGEVSAQQTNEVAEKEGMVKIEYFDSHEEAVEWLQKF